VLCCGLPVVGTSSFVVCGCLVQTADESEMLKEVDGGSGCCVRVPRRMNCGGVILWPSKCSRQGVP